MTTNVIIIAKNSVRSARTGRNSIPPVDAPAVTDAISFDATLPVVFALADAFAA